jgi:uncharacterized protein YndB with AHSA1/START domain
VVTSVEVDRSAEDVFAYATDPTRFSEWQRGVVSGRMEEPADLRVGAPAAQPPVGTRKGSVTSN